MIIGHEVNHVTRVEVAMKLQESGLARLAERIALLLCGDCVRFRTRVVDEAHIPLSRSIPCGRADQPPDVTRPEFKQVPLSFLAQMHLRDIMITRSYPNSRGSASVTRRTLFKGG